jgi:hypothetical protein
MTSAILRDERDLVWLLVDGVEPEGGDVCFDIHLLARAEPHEPPETLVSTRGHREPREAIDALLRTLAEAARGDVTAARLDPVRDGLSFEVKRPDDGPLEVVLWLDLLRFGRALRARGERGRQQAGLRFFTTEAAMLSFVADFGALVDPSLIEA